MLIAGSSSQISCAAIQVGRKDDRSICDNGLEPLLSCGNLFRQPSMTDTDKVRGYEGAPRESVRPLKSGDSKTVELICLEPEHVG
jgi:hypothetical protein